MQTDSIHTQIYDIPSLKCINKRQSFSRMLTLSFSHFSSRLSCTHQCKMLCRCVAVAIICIRDFVFICEYVDAIFQINFSCAYVSLSSFLFCFSFAVLACSLYLWFSLFDASAFQSRYMRKHITEPLHALYQTKTRCQ